MTNTVCRKSQKNASLHNAQLIIVTGDSGAGKSTVLRALEDEGFFCIDNLPMALLDSFFTMIVHSPTKGQRLALGVDSRGCFNDTLLAATLMRFKTHSESIKIFFLSSSSGILVKRFQETRRKHPLANGVDLYNAIAQEKKLLKPLRDAADYVLDTDHLNIHQLRGFVRSCFAPDGVQNMIVTLRSFGFKYGVPLESNFVYDIRSLPNPYFIAELKSLSGKDSPVQDYLFNNSTVLEYWNRLLDFVLFTVQQSHDEGRYFMHIAIGCTGGKHRSVAFVEKLAGLTLPKVQFLIEHRDLMREYSSMNDHLKEIST